MGRLAGVVGCVAGVLALAAWLQPPRYPAVVASPTVDAPGTAARVQRPHLWVLSVGVSDYRDPGLRLRYAADDATALANALARQADGPLYDTVHTALLVDTAATRQGILEALDTFLGRAAPIDVAVIFLAGHGLRTERPVAHYFLTEDASPTAPHIAGIDMDELRRQLLRLHRSIPRMVVVLDTCHAGAVAGANGVRFGADLSSGLAPLEGLYILTSASPGQRSVELASQGHGAFTAALLDGLAGDAARPDGLITVLGLVNHAIRTVDQLTGGEQRPYISIIGEDIAFAADPNRFAHVTPPPMPTPAPAVEPAVQRERIAIGDFEYFGPDASYAWMHRALSQDVLTAFSEVRQLEVFDEKMLRFVARDAPDTLEAAQRAGVGLLVQGAYWVQNRQLSISAQVQSIRPLQVVASARAEGPVDDFGKLTGQIMLALLDQLHVAVPAPLGAQLRNPGSGTLNTRRLLTEADGDLGRERGAPPIELQGSVLPGASHLPRERAPAGWLTWLLQTLVPRAVAQAPADAETALRLTLEEYRQALEREDLTALPAYYEDFAPSQAAALSRYFDNVEDLQIALSDVQIAIIGDQAAVSFTRHDRFLDRERGEVQDVRVRVTKRFAYRSGRWIMLNDT